MTETAEKKLLSFPKVAMNFLANEAVSIFNPDYSRRDEIVKTVKNLGYERKYESVLEETYVHPSRLYENARILHPSISITYDRIVPTVRVTTSAGYYYGLVGNRSVMKDVLSLLHAV